MVLLSRPLMGKSGFVYLFVYLIDCLFVLRENYSMRNMWVLKLGLCQM